MSDPMAGMKLSHKILWMVIIHVGMGFGFWFVYPLLTFLTPGVLMLNLHSLLIDHFGQPKK